MMSSCKPDEKGEYHKNMIQYVCRLFSTTLYPCFFENMDTKFNKIPFMYPFAKNWWHTMDTKLCKKLKMYPYSKQSASSFGNKLSSQNTQKRIGIHSKYKV